MILSVITLIWLLNSALSVTIPVTIEEVTSPAVKFNQYVYSMIFHPSHPRFLIVIDRYAIWEFNPDTKTKTLIAGSTTRGYVEGFDENAQFGDIYGSAKFNKTTIIITSYSNECMRLVNTETRMTERYAGVCLSPGFKDGNRLSAQFSYPWGISRIGSDFYVCDEDNTKIRKISQNVVSTITSPSYYPRGLSSNNDKLIYTFINGLGEFDLNSQSNKILTGGSSPGYTDGSLSSAQFRSPDDVITLTENIFVIAEFHNQAVRIVDLDKRFVSSVDLSGSPYSVLVYNGNIMVGMNGGSILKFNIYKLPVAASVTCPGCIKLMSPEGSSSLNVNIAQPDINGTRLECLSCPSATQQLSVGNHNMTFIYEDKLTREHVSCSYMIEVIKTTPDCHNATRHIYLERNQTKTEPLSFGGYKIRFKPGITEVKVDEECYHNFIVHAWDFMERRAYVQATYLFDCKTLTALSLALIESHVKKHTKHLLKYCSGCRVNALSPEIQCLKDKLYVTWETDFTGNQQVLPTDIKNKLESSVGNFHIKYPEMDIISVINTKPRVASPVTSKSGLYLDVVIRTSCLEKGFVYKFQSDTCEQQTVDDVEVNCPDDVKMILPPGVNELNITLPRPQVDELRLKCINCLDSVQSLSEGVHNITYEYMDIVYNQTTSCSYLINVIKQSTPVCQNETRRLFLKPDQQKTDEIKIGKTGFAIKLDSGVHELNTGDDCYITFIVNEVSSMERKVTLEAEYPIKCSTLNKISFSVIDSYLSQHTKYLKMYCPDCQVDESAPISTCTNDTLISSWRTNIGGNRQVPSVDIKSKLHTALVQFQTKYPVMDIRIFTTLPRTVSPIKDSTGLNLRVVIRTTCTDKELIYNKQHDVCQRVTN